MMNMAEEAEGLQILTAQLNAMASKLCLHERSEKTRQMIFNSSKRRQTCVKMQVQPFEIVELFTYL